MCEIIVYAKQHISEFCEWQDKKLRQADGGRLQEDLIDFMMYHSRPSLTKILEPSR